jgi:hypothetical protein
MLVETAACVNRTTRCCRPAHRLSGGETIGYSAADSITSADPLMLILVTAAARPRVMPIAALAVVASAV